MVIVFIDNGVTGTIGIIDSQNEETLFMEMPAKKVQDYTKKKKNITRIDAYGLYELINEHVAGKPCMFFLERPMVNPTRFTATISAVRALEATISIIEALGLPYQFVDSKEWQKGLLPSSGKKGTDSATLKKESHDIGLRLFPQHSELINKHKDADGILGAYAFSKMYRIKESVG